MLRSEPLPTASAAPRVILTPMVRLILIALVAAAMIVIFMTINSRGNWDFVLPFRGRKVLAIVVVAVAIAISTVVFQTITANRILTPSIMGFDALYMLVQTIAVFSLGGSRLLQVDPRLRFLVDVLVMVVFSGLLFWWLFIKSNRSLHMLVLIGIIFGTLFRSATNMLQRMIDPTDFAVLQDIGFASFNSVDPTLVGLGASIVVVMALIVAWRNRILDAMQLGRAPAISIGVDYSREVMIVLALTSILISVSTALVGPITFFGLLVAHLAYQTVGSSAHRYTVPAASCYAITFLVGGQLILEHVFNFNSSLSIMVEFVGGVLFILLLIRGNRK
ncbi:MAG: iron chelate uptake ABC transporter family permease subunit [Thermomicrobiales bacterium]|nr:iron chelate uptake ABC transporter family permease subunit [Thermomicrobiales bacterium]